MFNNASLSHFWQKHGMLLLALCFAMILLAMPHIAHASTDGGGQNLPFEAPLKKLTDSIKGPVAFSISLIGIIAAGAVLIFGGEMSGFLRTMVFLVLVIAIIANAANLVGMVGGDGATIAESTLLQFKSNVLAARGMG